MSEFQVILANKEYLLSTKFEHVKITLNDTHPFALCM